VKVLAVEGPLRAELGELPAQIELVGQPAPDVEVAVLGIDLLRRLDEVLAALPGLRLALSVFAGVEQILARVPEDVVVCGGSGAHDIGVSEWVLAVILAMRRRLPEFLEFQRRGEWERNVNTLTATGPSPFGDIADLDGANVLIVGYGSIGRAVGARLAPFGAQVIGVARRPRPDAHLPDALPRLIGDADVVVILVPLTAATEQMVNADFLAQMKPGALLVNASRGRTVDTEALVDALHAGHVRAALDVTDPEPLPEGHPLWTAPGVLITPHISSGVRGTEARAWRIAGDQLRRYVAGEPLINVASR
jgi:phosphoglycerate dehydrogenase-like enzyme